MSDGDKGPSHGFPGARPIRLKQPQPGGQDVSGDPFGRSTMRLALYSDAAKVVVCVVDDSHLTVYMRALLPVRTTQMCVGRGLPGSRPEDISTS